MQAANTLTKQLIYLAGAEVAGITVGTRVAIILLAALLQQGVKLLAYAPQQKLTLKWTRECYD